MRIEDYVHIFLDDAIFELSENFMVKNKLTWKEACDFTRSVFIGEATDNFIESNKQLWVKKLSKRHKIKEEKMQQIVHLVLQGIYDKRHADTSGLFCDVKLRWSMEKLLGQVES